MLKLPSDYLYPTTTVENLKRILKGSKSQRLSLISDVVNIHWKEVEVFVQPTDFIRYK